MHRDDEPDLTPAFAELHRRQRAEAPPFGAMRERALHAATARRASSKRSPGMLRVQWAAATVGVAATALWWISRLPESTPPNASGAASAQRMEQLLTLIEQELELSAAISAPVYPTDLLLTQNPTDPSP